MSMHLYLEEEELRNCLGFNVIEGQTTLDDKRAKVTKLQYRLQEKWVYCRPDDKQWYAIVSDDIAQVPEAFEDLVFAVSLHGYFVVMAARECGLYRFRSAIAELTITGPRDCYVFKIEGQTLFDVCELLRLIKAGEEIRPETSYEGPQGGLSRAELEAELKRKEHEITYLRGLARSFEEALSQETTRLTERFQGLVEKLRGASWPFGFKPAIADQIDEILAK